MNNTPVASLPGKIGIIANPKAAAGKTATSRKQLTALLRTQDQIVWTESTNQLRETLERYRQEQIEGLGICGGDGTIRLTLVTALTVWNQQPLPPIFFLRGGTMNVIPFSFGVRGSPRSILHRIFRQQDSTTLHRQQITMLKVGDTYGFIFGCGSFVTFLDDYYQKPRPTPLRALRLCWRTLVSALLGGDYAKKIFAGVNAKLAIDDSVPQERRYTLISTSTVRHVGFHFRPYFFAQQKRLAAHLLLATASPWGLAKNTVNFFVGRPAPKHYGIDNLEFNRVVIDLEQPVRFSLDGDLLTAPSPLQISLGPEICLLTP